MKTGVCGFHTPEPPGRGRTSLFLWEEQPGVAKCAGGQRAKAFRQRSVRQRTSQLPTVFKENGSKTLAGGFRGRANCAP